MMQIGFDAKRLFNNFTGLGNYSRTLVKNLLHYYPGNAYHLYTTRIKNNPNTTFFNESKSCKVHQSPAVFKSLWRSYYIADQLQRDQIKVYHGLSNELPFGFRGKGIKSVVTIHDLIFKVFPDTYPMIDRRIYDLKFRKSCQEADTIIAISKHTKKDIVHFYDIDPDKIEVIYQSLDTPYWTEEAPLESSAIYSLDLPADFLLSVGNIERRKNLEVILEALPNLPKDLQIPLVIVGKGKKYGTEMKKLAVKMKLGKKVIWLDKLESNDQLRELYRRASALLYPSLYEGFGLPVAEA